MTLEDVTERHVTARLLVESQERFRTMADSAPVLLWMAATDSRCVFFNKVWLEFTGRPLEKEVGVGWAEGVHPEDFEACVSRYMERFAVREPFRMEYRLRRADGAYRWILDTGVPRFGPGGEFLGYIGSCVDITEMKEALDRQRADEAALLRELTQRERAEQDLRASLREKVVLIQEIHHRVKNNLQIMASLLRIEEARAARAGAAGIHRGSLAQIRAMAFLHELLYRSPDLSRVDLDAYLRRVAGHVLELHGASAANVTLDLDLEPVTIEVSRAMPCGLILSELVSNCLKHAFPAERRGRIRVGLRSAEASLLLSVRDDGRGLDEAAAKGETFGTELVASLAGQIGASVERVERGGLEVLLTVPFGASRPGGQSLPSQTT